jgi:hypothetical protein
MMKTTMTTLLLVLALAPALPWTAASAAGTEKPAAIQQNAPRPAQGVAQAALACAEHWKPSQVTPSGITCESQLRGSGCGPKAQPLVGPYCAQAGLETSCQPGWRVRIGSHRTNQNAGAWACEPDPSPVRCPAGWAGPLQNGSWDKPPYTVRCQLPPR